MKYCSVNDVGRKSLSGLTFEAPSKDIAPLKNALSATLTQPKSSRSCIDCNVVVMVGSGKARREVALSRNGSLRFGSVAEPSPN